MLLYYFYTTLFQTLNQTQSEFCLIIQNASHSQAALYIRRESLTEWLCLSWSNMFSWYFRFYVVFGLFFVSCNVVLYLFLFITICCEYLCLIFAFFTNWVCKIKGQTFLAYFSCFMLHMGYSKPFQISLLLLVFYCYVLKDKQGTENP